MKKFFALALLATLSFGMTGCGKDTPAPNEPNYSNAPGVKIPDRRRPTYRNGVPSAEDTAAIKGTNTEKTSE